MTLPARPLSIRTHLVPGQLVVAELLFEVPLDYSNPTGETLQLFGRAATKYERPIVVPSPPVVGDNNLAEQDFVQAFSKPWLVYLEGGPGVGNREPQDLPLTRFALARGYQMLYLDYRGTGSSTPVNAYSLGRRGDAKAQADYLKHFRADNIVRDCEAVRLCLTANLSPERRQWSILGQSFGGFVSLTYLSKSPHGLREVFITGGLAPLDKTAEDVYRATFEKAVQRNLAYFTKYPEDEETLNRLSRFFSEQEGHAIPLPSGGKLTLQRVLILGQGFGFHGGFDGVHAIILRMKLDLEQLGTISRATLVAIEQFIPLDTCPIYAILHEPIYCFQKGMASGWAAEKVGGGLPNFSWIAKSEPPSAASEHPPLFFSGEMIFKFMFDVFPELAPMKEAADILAAYDGWEELYDEKLLAQNVVPVYAASFIDDIYVDIGFARETARKVKGIKVYETNSLYHNAIRSRTEEVLMQLFRLRDDTID